MGALICLHLNKIEETKRTFDGNYSMPAEYISREHCPKCGETSGTDETLYTDIVAFLGNLEDVQIADIDTQDCPDFCDAYLEKATQNGLELSEMELEYVNENCGEWINKMANLQFNGG